MLVANREDRHYWAIHKPGTPGTRLCEYADMLGNILQLCVVLFILIVRSFRSQPHPVTVGLTSAQEENSITPQSRCKPVQVIPNTSWKDLLAFLRNPTHDEIRQWMRKGEMATWPYIQALHVRMDIEIELHSEWNLSDLEFSMLTRHREVQGRPREQAQEDFGGPDRKAETTQA